MFQLTVSDIVRFGVRGTLKDSSGADVTFSFRLEGSRMDADELDNIIALEKERAALEKERAAQGVADEDAGAVPPAANVADVLKRKITGWLDVVDENGRDVPFSTENFARMLRLLGMPSLCYGKYIEACGAKGKEKN